MGAGAKRFGSAGGNYLMARPTKTGLDYYPIDVTLMIDRKLRKSKITYGPVAILIYISLLTIIYRDRGYYIDFKESDKEDVALDIMELLGPGAPDVDTILKIINSLITSGLFCKDQATRGILTSVRIQKTYYKACGDRRKTTVLQDIWLLDTDEMIALSKRNPISKQAISWQQKEQSKVKETKTDKADTAKRKEIMAKLDKADIDFINNLRD